MLAYSKATPTSSYLQLNLGAGPERDRIPVLGVENVGVRRCEGRQTDLVMSCSTASNETACPGEGSGDMTAI